MMCILTADCGMPSVFATMARPAAGVWLGAHSSTLSPCQCATQFSGSSGVCEMKGYM